MNFIKSVFILIFSVAWYTNTAQTYQLTVESRPFAFLEDPQLAIDEAWWTPEFQIPLGFDFELFDYSSDSIYPNFYSEGGVFNLNLDYDHLYMLIPLYASLIDRGYQQDSALSPIHYKTEGSPGQYIFTLEFKEAGLFEGDETDDGVFLDHISFQIRLYEESGDIEFHYGPYVTKEDPEVIFVPNPGPLVGLLADADWDTPGGPIAEVILLEGDPLSPSVFTGNGPTSLDGPIPENTVYRFSKMETDVVEIDSRCHPLLYPNPTSGEVQLKPESLCDIIYPIRVIDTQGKQICLWRAEEDVTANNLAPGCYTIVIHTIDNVVVESLIVLPK